MECKYCRMPVDSIRAAYCPANHWGHWHCLSLNINDWLYNNYSPHSYELYYWWPCHIIQAWCWRSLTNSNWIISCMSIRILTNPVLCVHTLPTQRNDIVYTLTYFVLRGRVLDIWVRVLYLYLYYTCCICYFSVQTLIALRAFPLEAYCFVLLSRVHLHVEMITRPSSLPDPRKRMQTENIKGWDLLLLRLSQLKRHNK